MSKHSDEFSALPIFHLFRKKHSIWNNLLENIYNDELSLLYSMVYKCEQLIKHLELKILQVIGET